MGNANTQKEEPLWLEQGVCVCMYLGEWVPSKTLQEEQ